MASSIKRIIVAACSVLVAAMGSAPPVFAAPVSLSAATATFCQIGWPVSASVDGSFGATNGWAIDPQEGNNHVAAYKAAADVGGPAGTELTFRLHTLYANHELGRFRLAATVSDRGLYGQGSECADPNPGGTAVWTVLHPQSVVSANGQTLSIQPDGSVLAGGSLPVTDVVTVGVSTHLQGITGFRLEALADASLPSNGPGRYANGNFVLTELVVDAQTLFRIYVYQSQFGSAGTGDGQFSYPVGVAIDPATHNVVVMELINNRGQIFSAASPYVSYGFAGKFGAPGGGDGQFSTPIGVAIDPVSHNIIVCDVLNSRIQVFTSTGTYLSQFGSFGTGNGQFDYPTAVAVDPISRNIVVVDEQNNRIQVFDSGGVYLSQFGSAGSGDGQFSLPRGVAIDPASQNIVVADGGNNRVQIFDSAGVYQSKFGTPGSGAGQFGTPLAVAIDPVSQNIAVSDQINNRVQIFSSAGVYVSEFGTAGTGNGQFDIPYGIAFDPATRNLVVADESNHRVQIFVRARIDIDGNGSYDALTDGLLISRYLSGMTGTALTQGVIGPGATISDPAQIAQRLDNLRPALDVDGVGYANASTDGLLLLRYLFGLRGSALVAGAVGAGATRTTSEIETVIQSMTP